MGPKATTSVDSSIQQLNAETKVLTTFLSQTEDSLRDENERKLKRLRDQMQKKVDESYWLITEITEMKLVADDDEDGVSNWTSEQENGMEVFETALGRIEDF